MSGPPPPSQKDAQQVLRYAFDDEDGALRVDATIQPGGADLEIHYEDDSIAIGDPNSDNILAINPDGSIKTVQLVTVPFDYVGITNVVIDGQTVPSVVQYKTGGASGTLVATLTLTYDSGANITSVTKT